MLAKEQIEHIDNNRFKWDGPFLQTITINECYISTVLCNSPMEVWYSVELVVMNGQKMMNIFIEMPPDDLKNMLKKSTNFSFERWMGTDFLLSINFREVFESYVHCEGFQLTVKMQQNDGDCNKKDTHNHYETTNLQEYLNKSLKVQESKKR